MTQRQSHDAEPRIRAPRERTIVTANKLRARAMRANPTEAERKLWWHIRHRLALPSSHFRRQVRLGRYIVDFANHQLKIVIEIDGGQHAEQIKHDASRTRFIELEGYRVLRFWNNEVLANIDGVLDVIQSACLATPTPAPPHKREGKGKTR